MEPLTWWRLAWFMGWGVLLAALDCALVLCIVAGTVGVGIMVGLASDAPKYGIMVAVWAFVSGMAGRRLAMSWVEQIFGQVGLLPPWQKKR